jgi:hypothetical protein
VELRIAHTLAVGLEIMEAATSQIRVRDLAADGLEQSREFPVSSSSLRRSAH